MSENDRFAGQSVCVVGGTAGIGLAIAGRAASEGASVTIAGRNSEKAKAVATLCGNGATGGSLDITDEASIEAFFGNLGEVDHLVITAASVKGGSFRTGALSDAKASFEGKFWSQYLCVRHAKVRRSILMFSGAFSRRPRTGTSIISAVNGAVDALGRALAVELAPLRVNVISPGLIQKTNAYAMMPEAARNAMIDDAAKRLPAGLVGDGGSVAAVAMGLLESNYVTGAVVDIDGGGLLV